MMMPELTPKFALPKRYLFALFSAGILANFVLKPI